MGFVFVEEKVVGFILENYCKACFILPKANAHDTEHHEQNTKKLM